VTPPLDQLLAAVRSADVEFATFTPEGSEFALLDRRVFVVAPPELAELAGSGDRAALDALVGLLRDPERAWAAEVLLAAMTRREEKEVEAFSGRSDEWWESLGASAHERWAAWLAEHGDRLRWDAETRAFVTQ
jgi:hypothetical protein